MNVDEHKRKIFIQKISAETTKISLDKYFSPCPIEWSSVPVDETGKNKKHGIVVFRNEESVDVVMAHRFHQIDGKEVFIHRSVPMQRSVKNNHGIQQLIVSSLNNQSLVESEIKKYFAPYGKIDEINSMTMGGETWIIYFDYYDSVDKVLLASPHRIGRIDVSVQKGDQDVPRRRSSTPGPTLKTQNNNDPGVIPKKSSLKQVTMNEQVACLDLPERKYRIHITNLPGNINAETLSEEFQWDIYDIVMDPFSHDRSVSTQCWLKNAMNEREIDDFIQRWKRRTISGSIIRCEKEEDDLELCNHFQFGRCTKSSDVCHWEHIQCTANGTCASTCPYGHAFGVKSRDTSQNNVTTTNTNYRIKISGFETPVTPENLTQRFGSHNYYIDSKYDRVGYVVKIKTMKFARQLLTKWHNKNIDGQKISCQLELNPTRLPRCDTAAFQTGSIDGDLKRNRSRSRPRDTRSVHSSQGTSDLEDINNTISTTFDNQELDRDRRICGKVLNDITRPSSKTNWRQANSSGNLTSSLIDTKYQLPSDVPTGEWEITNKASNSDGKVLLIRGQADRKRLAVIKIYFKQPANSFDQEIMIMKDLKDIQGVSQLIEPENTSNNFVQRRVDNDCLWMIMKRASGCSLKEFIERKCQDVLGISAAIQLTINLVGILQQVHKKGLVHRNLSPENIMIEWDLKVSIDRAQLTVLNFNQAMIVSDRTSMPVITSTQKWYHAPQIDNKGLSSTVDSSGICAILFWLLTRIAPRHDTNEHPHQQAHEKLDDVVKSAVKSIEINQQIALEGQLKMYLIDTFDRAFGYPHHHPWMINDLECRLKSILQLLTPIEPKLTTIDGIFQELVSISDLFPIPPVMTNDVQRHVFAKASEAFCQAKKHFSKNGQNQYEWSDGQCTWVHCPHNSINECYNDDILTYHSVRGRTTTFHSVIITCLASFSEQERVITLSLGSNVNGKTIQMPIGQYSTAKDYGTSVQESFQTELRNLLLAIYNERKIIE